MFSPGKVRYIPQTSESHRKYIPSSSRDTSCSTLWLWGVNTSSSSPCSSAATFLWRSSRNLNHTLKKVLGRIEQGSALPSSDENLLFSIVKRAALFPLTASIARLRARAFDFLPPASLAAVEDSSD